MLTSKKKFFRFYYRCIINIKRKDSRVITKINGVENTYINQNKKISFKSQIVPNKTIEHAFNEIRLGLKILKSRKGFAQHGMSVMHTAKEFLNHIKKLLNDGNNELIEFTRDGYKINGKKGKKPKINMHESASKDVRTITNEDFDMLNSVLSRLRDDLNADYESKNLDILANLYKNIQKIDNVFLKRTGETLDEVEKQIFKSRVK